MKQIIASEFGGNIQLEEETLSDGSRVYNVIIGKYRVACEGLESASDLFKSIILLIAVHSI